MIKTPRLCIAAGSSGAGKTTLSCALLKALLDRGLNIAAFKCGPDYIDPMFHREVTGTFSSNLDLFMLGEETLKGLFEKNAEGKDMALIEGVMGFYDGMGLASSEGSTWDIARITETPVILAEDCGASSLSAAARIYGMARFKTPAMARGVILNNCGDAMFAALKPVIEQETGLKVCGYLPRMKDCKIESRHLGLVRPEEIDGIRSKIAVLAAQLEKSVDIDMLFELSLFQNPVGANLWFDGQAPGKTGQIGLKVRPGFSPKSMEAVPKTEVFEQPRLARGGVAGGLPPAGGRSGPGRPALRAGWGAGGRALPLKSVPVAVASDRAFCFYYKDALNLLKDMGAELLEFSPLADKRLPRGAKGLYLGGGYPELYAGVLSGNETLRRGIREAVQGGLPCVAECGGFMYLHETLSDEAGKAYPMCGVIKGGCEKQERLVRFGYASYTALGDNLLCPAGVTLRGHEFHYWESDNPGEAFEARKPASGKTWRAIAAEGNLFAGFPHFHFCANPDAAERFLTRCGQYGT
jgi:cobyrinic acid a,c-diamide synthase